MAASTIQMSQPSVFLVLTAHRVTFMTNHQYNVHKRYHISHFTYDYFMGADTFLFGSNGFILRNSCTVHRFVFLYTSPQTLEFPMSEHLYTFINPSNPKHLDRVDHILHNHGVVALPMGTSWAFCCNYMSKKGIDKLRKLNPNHPDDRPFSLICNEISMISQVGSVGNQIPYLNKIFPGPSPLF